MRRPSDMPRRSARPRRPGRGRLAIIIGAVVLFVLVTATRGLAEFWTDYLWFDSVGFSSVWSKTLLVKIELGAIFTGVFFVLMWGNLLIADHISPPFRPMGPEEEILTRYHQVVDRRAGLVRFVVAFVFALTTGAGMSAQWNQFVLFTNGGDFGTTDPIYGVDVGFYVFRLPFLVTVVDWVFAALVIVLLVVAVVHYLNGGIRLQSPVERVSPQVKAHLSVLLALLALTKAADYWLQRYQLLFSERSGVVGGATATEVDAQLPALYLLLFIALAATVLFLLNIRRRGWVLPVVAVGIWAILQLVVGEAYPAFYQRFMVQPEESTREAQYIENNIQATREAFGLDQIQTKKFDYSSSASEAASAVTDNPEIIRNVQLLDPNIVEDAFQRLQSLVSPYQFADVATDRYQMTMPGGELAETQVVVANREMNAETIPQKSWEGRHLSYTHGYGFALAAGGGVTQSGSPDFAVYDIPLQTDGRIDVDVPRPAVYYGINPNMPDYSIVGSSGVDEVGYLAKDGSPKIEEYEGAGGVSLDSTLRRAAYWLKFNDFNLLISNYVRADSRILYVRDVRERVRDAAPFLRYDSDPYPVTANGRMYYVVDAYTASTTYPNSQRLPRGAADGELGQADDINYLRNSVKAIVDTYDGSITFYVMDDSDPVINAYRAAFPELFKDSNQMSSELRAHLRYPQDLFRVQADLWGRYHITDPKAFYDRTNAWEAPTSPPSEPPTKAASSAAATPAVQQQTSQFSTSAVSTFKVNRIAPAYVINRMPGDEDPSFMLMRPYQPFSDNDSKNQMTAFIVAKSDPDGPYGELEVFEVPSDQVDGPTIVSSTMLADTSVSREVTFFEGQGSRVRFGALQLLPLERSILYVRPMYVVAEGNVPLPQVKRVIVWFNGRVVISDTLRSALKLLLPGSDPQTLEGAADRALPPSAGGDDTTTGTAVPGSVPGSVPPDTAPPAGSGDVAYLIDQANRLFEEADVALRNGDLAGYQSRIDQARKLLQQAATLAPTTTVPSTTTPSDELAPTTPSG